MKECSGIPLLKRERKGEREKRRKRKKKKKDGGEIVKRGQEGKGQKEGG